MRLFIVTRESGDDRRYGIGQGVGRIAHGLSARGHTVRYVTQQDCQQHHQRWRRRFTQWLQPAFHGCAPALAERCVQGIWAAGEALRWQASHVWLQDPWLMLGFRLGLLKRGCLRRPFALMITEHGLGAFSRAVTYDGLAIDQRRLHWLLRLEGRFLAQADAVLCPSNAVRENLLRDLRLNAPPLHWHVIGYGRPTLTLPDREFARRQLGITHNAPVVLAMGRIAPVKRYYVLLKAMAQLQNRFATPAQLLIAGDGDRATLLQQAQQLGLHYSPRLGALEDTSLALAAADVYTSACGVEAFGMANREAIAAHLPSVIATGGASDEVLGNGAWLVPGFDTPIAQALATLLNQPDIYRFWQQQARYASGRWASWDSIITAYETLLHELAYG